MKTKYHYGWVIAAVSFIMVFIGLGLCNSPHGLYLVPVTAAVGMTRAQFSAISSFRFAASTVCNIMFGYMHKKFGLRRLAIFGSFMICLALATYSVSSNPAMFYMGGVFQGIGTSFAVATTATSLVNNWFSSHRGTVLGVVLSASGIGGALFSQLVSFMIENMGWRFSYRTAACLSFFCLILVFLFIREHPSAMGLEPVGGKSEIKTASAKPLDRPGATLKAAIRGPFFYIIMISAFFIGFLNNPIYVSVPSQMADAGLAASASASVTSLLFVSIALSKMGLGVVNDRIGFTPTLCICFISNIIGLVLLIFAHQTWHYFVFAAIFGLSIPLENLMLSITVGRVFGHREFSTFMGMAYASSAAGIAVGNPLMGWCSDRFGSYLPMLTFCTVLAAVLFVIMLFMTRKERYPQT